MVGEKRQVATLERLQTSRLSLSESLNQRGQLENFKARTARSVGLNGAESTPAISSCNLELPHCVVKSSPPHRTVNPIKSCNRVRELQSCSGVNSICTEELSKMEGLAFLSGVNKQPRKRHPPSSVHRKRRDTDLLCASRSRTIWGCPWSNIELAKTRDS